MTPRLSADEPPADDQPSPPAITDGAEDQDDEKAEEYLPDEPARDRNVFRRFWPRWRATDEHERNHRSVREAFRTVVKDAGKSTVQIVYQNRRVALGTVVGAEGYIVTKASELKETVECRLADGRKLRADVITVDEKLDIALLHVDATDLTPVQWRESEPPLAGSWLATVGPGEVPAAIGVVSASPRTIPAPRPVLGVQLEPIEGGARIGSIIPESPAEEAGLKENDVIVEVNGREVKDREGLISYIQTLQPGENVELVVLREEERVTISARLTDINSLAHGKRVDFQNSLGGPLSTRRWGFASVLQHDTVLRPNDCGGPVVDLDGRAVGINIARAGRVASYALPVQVVMPLVADVRSGKFNQAEAIDETQLAARIEELRTTVKQWTDRFAELQRQVDEKRESLVDVDPASSELATASEELAHLESEAAAAKSELDKALQELRRFENPENTSITTPGSAVP
jgi:serine protease Do